jgi:hypothetical protein
MPGGRGRRRARASPLVAGAGAPPCTKWQVRSAVLAPPPLAPCWQWPAVLAVARRAGSGPYRSPCTCAAVARARSSCVQQSLHRPLSRPCSQWPVPAQSLHLHLASACSVFGFPWVFPWASVGRFRGPPWAIPWDLCWFPWVSVFGLFSGNQFKKANAHVFAPPQKCVASKIASPRLHFFLVVYFSIVTTTHCLLPVCFYCLLPICACCLCSASTSPRHCHALPIDTKAQSLGFRNHVDRR